MIERVKVRQLDGVRLAGVAHRGDYRRLGLAFERLRGLLDPGDMAHVRRGVSIGHDDPRSTPEIDLRAHACVIVTEAFRIRPPLEELRYPAGRYAVLQVRGPYEQLPEAYRATLGDWLVASGEAAAWEMPYDVYLNDPRDTPPADLLTEIRLLLR